MGNKRQRLARKTFKLVTGAEDLCELQSATETAEQVKKKIGKKRKSGDVDDVKSQHGSSQLNGKHLEVSGKGDAAEVQSGSQDNGAQAKDEKSVKKPGKKHPLRMPGMKPGEGCFLCKSTDHIAKLCPTKNARDRKKICLQCRAIGHTLKNCPTSFETQETKLCYNCGENGHRLADCKKPQKNGGSAFAECFVCKQKGHLSKSCPTNPHGIYPKGGSCKLCGGVEHLAKDCPTKKARGHARLLISTATGQASLHEGGGKHTVFKSGDDLGDDFVSDDEEGNSVGVRNLDTTDGLIDQAMKRNLGDAHTPVKNKLQTDLPAAVVSNVIASSNRQQGPKIINFKRP